MLLVEREGRAVEAGGSSGGTCQMKADGARVAHRRRAELPGRAQSPVPRPASNGPARVELRAGAGRSRRRRAGRSPSSAPRDEAGAVARAGAGGHVAVEVEGRLAGVGVLHQAVGGAVERIALGEHGVRDQRALGRREAGATRSAGLVASARVGLARRRCWRSPRAAGGSPGRRRGSRRTGRA